MFPRKRSHQLNADSRRSGLTLKPGRDSGVSLYKELVAGTNRKGQTGEAQFIHEIGYRIIGPIYVAFTTWLIDQARILEPARLCFLARDGKILRQVYNRMHEIAGEAPLENHYIYASRRLFNLAAVFSLDERNLDFLCSGRPLLPVRAFLERIGLPVDSAVPKIRKAGFTGPDQIVQRAHYAQLYDLFRQLKDEIEALAAEERNCLLRYLDSLGIVNKDPLGIVDIGWQGSIQTSLHKLLDSVGSPTRLDGFYFGLYPEATGNQHPSSRLHGFYTHNGEPVEHFHTVYNAIGIVEYFFSSTDRSCIRIEDKDGTFEPVYDQYKMLDSDAAMLQGLQSAAMEFVDDYTRSCGGSIITLPAELPFRMFERLLNQPTNHEVNQFGSIRFSDGFGNTQLFGLMGRKANILRNLMNPWSFKRDFKASFWRSGFFSQLSFPERQLLRLIAPVASSHISG